MYMLDILPHTVGADSESILHVNYSQSENSPPLGSFTVASALYINPAHSTIPTHTKTPTKPQRHPPIHIQEARSTDCGVLPRVLSAVHESCFMRQDAS